MVEPLKSYNAKCSYHKGTPDILSFSSLSDIRRQMSFLEVVQAPCYCLGHYPCQLCQMTEPVSQKFKAADLRQWGQWVATEKRAASMP